MDLFSQVKQNACPLPERMRPSTPEQILGTLKSLPEGRNWIAMLENSGALRSLILYGPPGCGKTTYAKLLKRRSDIDFIEAHAIETGAKALREIAQAAKTKKIHFSQRTVLFIDEIHRLNRAQQDVLLAGLEAGDFILVGATTENPSHALNPAVLSRVRVLMLQRLSEKDLDQLIDRTLVELGYREHILDSRVRKYLIETADFDARKVLGSMEIILDGVATNHDLPLSLEEIKTQLGNQNIGFDQEQDRFDLISALIKSIRGSDPDASVYYLARLVAVQENIPYLNRRLVTLASEDIGNADPNALQIAVACSHATELVGWPEARIIFSQAVIYLACAPKANTAYIAINEALQEVGQSGSLPVPLALRSSKTQLSKSLGFGQGYKYSHEGPRGYIKQDFLPQTIKQKKFVELAQKGFEKKMIEYQKWVRDLEHV